MALCITMNWHLEWSGTGKWPIPPIGEKPYQPISAASSVRKAVTKHAFQAKWYSKCRGPGLDWTSYILSSYVIHIIDETVHLNDLII